MNSLTIAETKSTPLINFDADASLLTIKGQSYPENSFAFYEPVLAWLKDYIELRPAQTAVQLSLRYINTSSSKCIMMILDALQDAFDNGIAVTLSWLCDPENEYEQECAEEFKEDYSFPFEIVAVPTE